MEEQVNIPALYFVWFLLRTFYISKRVLVIHVSQDRDKAFGWSQFRGMGCLEKVKIVKLYITVPQTNTGG